MNCNDDGTLVVHQSDLNDFRQCPEQFRATRGIEPGGNFLGKDEQIRIENDAALIGTVCHSVFEQDLRDGTFTTAAQMKAWARNTWHEHCKDFLRRGVEMRMESYGTHQKCLEVMNAVLDRWWKSTERAYWLMAMQDHGKLLSFEMPFEVPLMTRPEKRYQKVNLAGIIDLLDSYEHRVVDYKTASRPYTRWEHQRWGIQESAYTFAGASLGMLDPHDNGLYQFDFRIFVKGEQGEPQSMTVWRSHDQWAWMIQQAEHMISAVESETTVWPLRDDGWWCSGKWCPIWKDCKGSLVTEEWT